MDCTTQLGMLRERRQRGQALLAGQRVVLCSPSWPLLVSQSTALQGGADVVAACTTKRKPKDTCSSAARTYSSATTSCNRDRVSRW